MKILSDAKRITFILSNRDLKEIKRAETPLNIEMVEKRTIKEGDMEKEIEVTRLVSFVTEETVAKLQHKTDKIMRQPAKKVDNK